MAKNQGMGLAVLGLALYIIGGISTFGGIALIVFMKGQDLFGWGDGSTLGYLFLAVGLCLSILGVLVMRIFQNRGLV